MLLTQIGVIEKYGADALRSALSLSQPGQDVFLRKKGLSRAVILPNKIWNASRFILMNLDAARIRGGPLRVFFGKSDLNPGRPLDISRFIRCSRK